MTAITNTDATEAANSFEICMRSGFKYPRGTLIREWSGMWVHPKFAEPKHPSDLGTPVTAERLTGSPRPERDDSCIGVNEVTIEDL